MIIKKSHTDPVRVVGEALALPYRTRSKAVVEKLLTGKIKGIWRIRSGTLTDQCLDDAWATLDAYEKLLILRTLVGSRAFTPRVIEHLRKFVPKDVANARDLARLGRSNAELKHWLEEHAICLPCLDRLRKNKTL